VIRADVLRSRTVHQPAYAVDDAPPNWGAGSSAGIWEIPVPPLPPSVPEKLPQWAQEEYDGQLQRLMGSQAGGGGRGLLRGGASSVGGRLPPSPASYHPQVRRSTKKGPLTSGRGSAQPGSAGANIELGLVSTCL